VITVAKIPVNSITVTPATLSMIIGGQSKLTATLLPATATIRTVTWSSDKPGVVSVAQDGTIRALSIGTASSRRRRTITA